jgi:hypothetical protein
MKNLIRFEDFVNEMNIIQKDMLAKGSYNQIYPVITDPNKVIKTGTQAIEHGKVFKSNPEYCPIVYKIVEKPNPYIVIEKLETEKAIKDYERLIDKDRGYIHNWGLNTFKKEKNYQSLRDLLTGEGKIFLDKVREIVLAIDMKDIHSRNFGYDKSGKLKALDI